jgi:hypothetical protein
MPSLKQEYEGNQLTKLVSSLTKEQFDNTFGVKPERFDGYVVIESDVVNAVPANLLGIINAAAVRLNLVSAEERALLMDVA